MSMYLARIEERNGYYNLRPVMESKDGYLLEVYGEKFGQYGTININMGYGSEESPLIKNGSYCIFTITDSEYESLEKTYGSDNAKIRLKDFLKSAKSVDSSDIREVIVLPMTLNVNLLKNISNRTVSDLMPPLSKLVYLDDGTNVFGPFSWKKKAEGTYEFNPSADEDQYMINVYEKEELSDILYAFDASTMKFDEFYGKERQIILINSLSDPQYKIDYIDDSALKEYAGRLISQTVENKRDKQEIKSAINLLPISMLSDDRREHILQLIRNGELVDEAIKLIPTVMLEDHENLDKIASIILDNDNYIEKVYPIIKTKEKYQEILLSLEKEKKMKENELLEVNNLLNEANEKGKESINFEELNNVQLELEKAQEELQMYKTREELQNTCEELQAKKQEVETNYELFVNLKNNIASEIQQKIKSAYTSFAFDGALASLMLKAASDFEHDQTDKEVMKSITTVENVHNRSSIISEKELVMKIYNELTIKAKRNITQNDVANILLCVSLGFLTVFAGEPGTGKTSLVNLFARILGLQNKENPRYVEVAVEKGWTSHRDLIGYYNPLTKTFDASNKGIFDSFKTLNAEYNSNVNDFPYLILLDEANLSPMEHYWAEFMGICDLDKIDRKITLSSDYVFNIPKTLRFLATINLDHTTEVLSPRLIDRAWIIKLDAENLDIDEFESSELTGEYPLITFDVFRNIMNLKNVETYNLEASIVDKFNKIKACFKEVGMYISPRVIGMIKKYCLAGKNIFDSSENTYVALDYAVSQKILPMIDGCGAKYQSFIENLISVCDQNTMPKCFKILNKIRQSGEDNMLYYQFFTR